MENVFLKQFLMISDVRTIAFLAVLSALFYLIHVLYHKKHMDFAAVVMIGTGLGLVLGLAIQFVAGFPDKPMEVAFVAETTTWFAMFGSGYINLIKMIVVPLVMISIMQVIINMQQGEARKKDTFSHDGDGCDRICDRYRDRNAVRRRKRRSDRGRWNRDC